MTDREILEYRLGQLEEKTKRLDELASSISRDQLRFQLDDAKITAHENKIEGCFKRIDEIRDRLPPCEQMAGRVNHILKALLSFFVATLLGVLVWGVKQGAV